MFSFTDMVHFLADEFTGLCAWSLSFPFIFTCSFDCLLFWHNLITYFDVIEYTVFRRMAQQIEVRCLGSLLT